MSRFASAAPSTRAALLIAVGVLALAVWMTLTLAIALTGLHRWNAHIDFARVPAWFWWFRADPQVSRWLKVGALGSGFVILFAGFGVAVNQRRPLHGAARFAREDEIQRERLRATPGILLGSKGGRMLSFGGAEHVLLYAPTRSGKGVGVVIPNLLNWPGSAVVLDIKRENFDATAGFRSAHGQVVHLFDPLASDGRTARFNPLGHIDRHKPTVVLDELQKIAAMLFPSEGGRTDPFWSEAARTGFIGVGAYVAETPDLPFSLGQVFRELTQGSPKARFPGLIADRARAGRPLSMGCVSALTDFCAASDNTFASIRQTITARMGLWLNPLVDAATSASDFDLRALRTRKITVYLAASPDNLARVAPLYNLFFQQLVDLNTRRRPASDETGQVLIVLDEFARLGHAGVLAHGFSFVAGYGLRILAVLQSPSQLRAEYGPDLADEIIANCGVEIAFTPKELKIAQELSARLGDYTYEGRSRSRPSGLSSGRRSQTESEQRRALMLPQELLQMPKDQLLVLRSGLPPIRGRKIVYYRDRAFTSRLLPPPERPKLSDAEAQGHRIQAIALEVASLRDAVEDIRTRVVDRPMSAPEAAGEAPLGPEQISLALADVDMDALPGPGASEAEVRRFMREYLGRASTPPGVMEADPGRDAPDASPDALAA